jgi:hypothetical protein
MQGLLGKIKTQSLKSCRKNTPRFVIQKIRLILHKKRPTKN